MFREFKTRNAWTDEVVEVRYQSTVSAVATRHADAVDFGFRVNGRRVWIALPLSLWEEFAHLTGRALDDRSAQRAAGLHLRRLLETGEETSQALYGASRDEALGYLEEILLPATAKE
jgi:putative aminopeptidase FrvX